VECVERERDDGRVRGWMLVGNIGERREKERKEREVDAMQYCCTSLLPPYPFPLRTDALVADTAQLICNLMVVVVAWLSGNFPSFWKKKERKKWGRNP
jgi:hypothetical protein